MAGSHQSAAMLRLQSDLKEVSSAPPEVSAWLASRAYRLPVASVPREVGTRHVGLVMGHWLTHVNDDGWCRGVARRLRMTTCMCGVPRCLGRTILRGRAASSVCVSRSRISTPRSRRAFASPRTCSTPMVRGCLAAQLLPHQLTRHTERAPCTNIRVCVCVYGVQCIMTARCVWTSSKTSGLRVTAYARCSHPFRVCCAIPTPPAPPTPKPRNCSLPTAPRTQDACGGWRPRAWRADAMYCLQIYIYLWTRYIPEGGSEQ